MTERTALRLVYVISAVLISAWMIGLQLLGVPAELIVLGPMFVLVGGATAVTRVTMHFAPSRRRHRDD